MALLRARYPLLFWLVAVGVAINIFGMALPFLISNKPPQT